MHHRATPGNVRFIEPGEAGALSDLVQLSNDTVNNNAFMTAISDVEGADGGVDPSLVGDGADLQPPRTELDSGFTNMYLRVTLNITHATDAGPIQVQVPTSIRLSSDAEQIPDGGQSDLVTFVPAAPPVAVWALALVLMGGGVYMARRQRINRG